MNNMQYTVQIRTYEVVVLAADGLCSAGVSTKSDSGEGGASNPNGNRKAL